MLCVPTFFCNFVSTKHAMGCTGTRDVTKNLKKEKSEYERF